MQPAHVSLSAVQADGPQPSSGAWLAGAGQAEPIDRADPLLGALSAAPGTVDVAALALDSPTLQRMRRAGVALLVPMVSQGEVLAALELGPRRNRQAYSPEDRELLSALAGEAAPALRLIQLAQARQREEIRRARIDQELQLARRVQQTLSPTVPPILPGWKIELFYQPARASGSDFSDFIALPDGRIAIVVGDVIDTGMPGALLMATTRTTIQVTAQTAQSAGETLARVNALVCRDASTNLFVTCLYVLLDPATGRIECANAGHPAPFRWDGAHSADVPVSGLPLGVSPQASYEQREIALAPGERLALYSDGMIEMRDAAGEMLGAAGLHALLLDATPGDAVVPIVREQLARRGPPNGTPAGDLTLLVITRDIAGAQESNPA
jgi:serine phosphatase RsbU (regulator of sigma subunit)